MSNVTFAIRSTITNQLAQKNIVEENWDTGCGFMTDIEHNIEEHGLHGLWTTDSLIYALAVLDQISSENNEFLPKLYNKNDEFEVVAIHAFNENIKVITTDHIPSTIFSIINNEDIVRAKTTSIQGDLNHLEHEFLLNNLEKQTDIQSTLKMTATDVYSLELILKQENRVPNVSFDKEAVKKACEACLAEL